ncbi:winged helix-turn-helix transcriptional regulator [Acinetobacter rongchengensis]|uniref:Transcriptional regulator n=1 Tax=Acinetobacter rongchengensis TaxID=2419601 RepID=A0A3A8F124_9GAMM|nr:helix-turn-helix domain-containing protein [Acinetobacter rongchengensis]RKG36730.1 transcriptional regulator [Acinetobacter rongchengensis]
MKIADIGNQPCSVARTLSVIGDTWSMMIIRNAFLGIRRFDDFHKNLGVTRHVLTARLNTLVEEEILYKAPYTETQKRFEYRLTQKGLDLYPILMSIIHWGDTYMDKGQGAPVDCIHKTCGHKFHPVMVCSECSEPLNPKQVKVEIGKGLSVFNAEKVKEA